MDFSRRSGDKYIDRGDLAAYDFTAGDFTKDSAWHDLTLSAIVGTGVKQVLFGLVMSSSDVAARIELRQKGNVNVINIAARSAPAAATVCMDDVKVLTNAAGVIEYRIIAGTYESLNAFIRGHYI